MDEIQPKNCTKQEVDTILLDKLAQPCRSSNNSLNIILLQKRARAKFITNPLTLGLINNNPDSMLKKSYWNTFYCNNTILLQDGKVHSKHCKNRWCLVCTRIKTATYINAYISIMKDLPDKQFVTLTVKNVPYNNLTQTLNKMQSSFNQIKSNHTLRGLFKGIRKLEITYNPITDEYHPHYHLVVSGYNTALILVDYWMKLFPNTSEDAQDIKQIDNDDNSLIEIFKYATKIIQKDIDKPNEKTIYFVALNNILIALKGRRTFQPFGIKKPKIVDDYSLELEQQSMDIDFYSWEQELSDWINYESGQLLSNYVAPENIKNFVANISKKGNKNG